MFVFVHALWCGHCKNFKPIVDKVKKEYESKKNKDFKFVEIEGDSTDELDRKILEKLKVDGYPTLLYVNKKNIINFDGERTDNALRMFYDQCMNLEK